MGLRAAGSRYYYDFNLTAQGWEQYDTDQDAGYFGVWVHRESRRVFTYAEGDRQLVVCETSQQFAAELASMEDAYGPAPPAFILIDPDQGTCTHVFCQRPSADGPVAP
jgi:hypothetical protein